MHITHLPQALILLLALAPTTLALPDPRIQQDTVLLDPRSPEARQRRSEAWKAQKPMHTTALLAGAAATAVSAAQIRNGRRRDWSGVTGEKGMWIPIEFWDGGDEVFGRPDGDGGSVRGEKVVDVEVEGEDIEGEGEDVEVDVDAYGLRGMIEVVWRNLERTGLIMQRGEQRLKEAQEPDSGRGDL